MRVRCGACGTEFEIQGPGRYRCPACQAVNEVRAAPPGGPMGGPMAGGMAGGIGGPMGGGLDPFGGGAAPPPPPDAPSPRVACPSCGFSFIVGDIDVAICPNCRAEVTVRAPDEEAS